MSLNLGTRIIFDEFKVLVGLQCGLEVLKVGLSTLVSSPPELKVAEWKNFLLKRGKSRPSGEEKMPTRQM